MAEKRNNAISTLAGALQSSGTEFVFKTGEGTIFEPSSNAKYPLYLTIEHYDTIGTEQVATKREIITITNIVGDVATIGSRAVQPCVQDDSATTKSRTQNALDFEAGDVVFMSITEDEFNGLLTKEEYQKATNIYGASSTGTDAYAITIDPVPTSYDDLRIIYFKADVANTGPATLNVNGLGALNLKKNGGQKDLETGDIAPNQVCTAVYNGTNLQFAGGLATETIVSSSDTQSQKTAGESISEGDAVAFVLANLEQGFGPSNSFDATTLFYNSVTQIDENKVLIAYNDSTNFGNAVVATISGTTITYGTVFQFFTGFPNYITATKLDTNKALISYDSSGVLKSKVATITGTNIAFGTETTTGGNVADMTSVQISTDKAMLIYRDKDNLDYGTGVIVSVTGTTISTGTKVAFNSVYTNNISCDLINTDKVFIGYKNDVADDGTGIVATISGTTITYGTSTVFDTNDTSNISVGKIDTDKILIGYRGTSNYGYCKVATISGTTITYGTELVFNTEVTSDISVGKIDTNISVILYKDSGNSNYGTGIVATISGTTITYGTSTVFESNETLLIRSTTISNGKIFNSYKSGTSDGKGIVFKYKNITDGYYKASASSSTQRTNFVGFANNSAVEGGDLQISTSGVNNKQSGLTENTLYYLSNNEGEIDTSAGDTSVLVGKSTEKTEILINTAGGF